MNSLLQQINFKDGDHTHLSCMNNVDSSLTGSGVEWHTVILMSNVCIAEVCLTHIDPTINSALLYHYDCHIACLKSTDSHFCNQLAALKELIFVVLMI